MTLTSSADWDISLLGADTLWINLTCLFIVDFCRFVVTDPIYFFFPLFCTEVIVRSWTLGTSNAPLPPTQKKKIEIQSQTSWLIQFKFWIWKMTMLCLQVTNPIILILQHMHTLPETIVSKQPSWCLRWHTLELPHMYLL